MINQSVFIGKALSSEDPVYRLSPHKQPPQPMQARLTVVRGAQNGEMYLLSSERTLFGRIEGWLLRDVLASRRHMQISRQGREFYLEDLQSTNGTYINGKPVTQPVALLHGDAIRVGETILIFEVSGEGSTILGFGAAPQRFADHTKSEVTIKTCSLQQALAEKA